MHLPIKYKVSRKHYFPISKRNITRDSILIKITTVLCYIFKANGKFVNNIIEVVLINLKVSL